MREISSQSKANPGALTPVTDRFHVPSPTEDKWTSHLKTLVQNAGVDRGSVEVGLTDSESTSSSVSTSNDDCVDVKRKKKNCSDEALFKKLKNNITARSDLSSIHAARSHKYGHVQFGPKKWYKESVHISEKFTSQKDRKKFRQGLKCNVDFLNQLNMHDLMSMLIKGKQSVSAIHKSVILKLGDIFECLKDVPLIEILRLIDKEKAQKILLIIDKIVALAHVSQSMGNYFARDDSLEPALSVVCQGLRSDSNFEHILRSGGTFQSLASAFHHLKSPKDRDFFGRGGIDLQPQTMVIVIFSSKGDDAQGGVVDTNTDVGHVTTKTMVRTLVG